MKVLDLALTGSLRWWALNTLSNHFYISTQPGVTKSLQCRKTKPLSGMPNQSILCSSKPINYTIYLQFTSTHFDWIDFQTSTKVDVMNWCVDELLLRYWACLPFGSSLSCHVMEDRWFDLMGSYGPVGQFLSVVSLLGISLYFITSSDSGSIVIDCLVRLY